MRYLYQRLLKRNDGVGIAMAMFAGAVVALGGLLIINSGDFSSTISSLQKRQDIVNNTMSEISSILADRRGCVESMGTNFTSVGDYNAFPFNIDDAGVVQLQSIAVSDVPSANERTVRVNFNIQDLKTGQVRTVRRFVSIQIFRDPDGTEYCMSFEQGGGAISVQAFCQQMGGNYNNNQCNFDNAGNTVLNPGVNFTEKVRERACNLLGGDFVGGRCNQVDIAGPVHSDSHFPGPGAGVDEIRLEFPRTTDRREAFTNTACGVGEVAVGFNPNGTLNCSTIDCNASLILSDPSAPVFSTFSATEIDPQNISCKCNRDFRFGTDPHSASRPVPIAPPTSPFPRPLDYSGPVADNNDGTVGCADTGGAPDPYSCTDYQHDDGCGFGHSCTILRGRFPGCCVTTTSEKYVIVNACNDICAVGPGCNADVDNPGPGCTVSSCPAAPLPKCPMSGSATAPNGRICISSVEASANSANAPGNCGGGVTGSCTMTCDSGGNWTVDNTQVTACVTAPNVCTNSDIDNVFNTNLGLNVNVVSPTIDNPVTPLVDERLNTEEGQTFTGTISCVSGTGSGLSANCAAGGTWNVAGTCTASTACNPATVTWGSGSCTADITNLYSDGSLVSVTDSTSSMQGTADFTCNNGTWVASNEVCNPVSVSPCSNGDISVSNATVNPSTGSTSSGDSFSGTISCNSGYTGGATATCNDGSWSISGGCSLSPMNSCAINAYVGGVAVLTGDFNQILMPGDSEFITNAQHSTYNTNCTANGMAVCDMTPGGGGRTYSCSMPPSCSTYNNQTVSEATLGACGSAAQSIVDSCNAVSGCDGTVLGSDVCEFANPSTATVGCFSDANTYSGFGCGSCPSGHTTYASGETLPNGSTATFSTGICNVPSGETLVSQELARWCNGFSGAKSWNMLTR